MADRIERLWTAVMSGKFSEDWSVRRRTIGRTSETDASGPGPLQGVKEITATYTAPRGRERLIVWGYDGRGATKPQQIRFLTRLDHTTVTLYDGGWPRPAGPCPDGTISAGDHLLIQEPRSEMADPKAVPLTRNFALVAKEGDIVLEEQAFTPSSPYHGLRFQWTGTQWEFHGSLAQQAQGLAVQTLLQQVQGRYTHTLDQGL